MRKFFIQLKILYLQEKKLSRITFDHISKLGKEFFPFKGQSFWLKGETTAQWKIGPIFVVRDKSMFSYYLDPDGPFVKSAFTFQRTLTTKDCKGPQTNMPKNVGVYRPDQQQ